MCFAGFVLDLDARTLKRQSGEAIQLTRGEFAILRMFVTRPGRVLSRDTLLDALANRRFEPLDRSVDVLIGRLRRKIELDPKEPCLIVTVPGEGYRFDGFAKAFQSTRTHLFRIGGGQNATCGDPQLQINTGLDGTQPRNMRSMNSAGDGQPGRRSRMERTCRPPTLRSPPGGWAGRRSRPRTRMS
jgi:DNA-binding winged helix-turn-helix (wHTH) protein